MTTPPTGPASGGESPCNTNWELINDYVYDYVNDPYADFTDEEVSCLTLQHLKMPGPGCQVHCAKQLHFV